MKVYNDGIDPIGPCRCAQVGAWNPASFFIDTATTTWPVNAPDGQSRLVQLAATGQFELRDAATNQVIAGPWFIKGKGPTGQQDGLNSFWAWSPDGKFFGVVVRDRMGTGGSWWLYAYATRAYTRGNGASVSRGSVWSSSGTSSASNVIAGSNVGWNGASTCLVFAAPPTGGATTTAWITLVCPYADASSSTAKTLTRALTTSSQGLQVAGYQLLHSPCGGLFAFVPKPGASPPPSSSALEIIDIGRTLSTHAQRQANVPVGPAVVSSATATIRTATPGRNGIALTGMNLSAIDNPECSAGAPGGVNVRRARVSTIPNTIDYQVTGQSSLAIWQGGSIWVELPSQQYVDPGGGQVHYCLQAIGDAAPDDPGPAWPAFDLNNRHCAQRNIVFA